MAQISNPLLNTKLFIPRSRPDLIPRARLTNMLQTGAWRALTLVSAPAGFGKTTLVADWVRESGWKAAWVSLDEGDNEVSRFLSYLTLALREIRDDIGQTALDALQSSQSPPVEAVMAGLLNEVATITDDFVVVLDDYHAIVAQPVHDALSYLLDHIPPQMHLVITTRADPPLPLSRLRVRGQMTEARASDLRFTGDETSEYLNDLMGFELSPEQIEVLETRTEGWIAGLQLAALSMQDRDDKKEFVEAFAGSHRFIIDYLVDEVLSRQSDEVQRFLRWTSVLERFNAPLCNAVTEMPDRQAILQHIEQSNLFLIPLDDDRRWFRYQHLFAEFLLQRLEESQPDLIPELHMRASQWFADEGWADEAIDHAIAGDSFEHAASLIERVAPTLVQNEEFHTLISWVTKLPDSALPSHPVLCLQYAWSLHFSGQVDAVEPLLEMAEANQHLAPNASVPALADVTRAAVASGQGNLARGIDLTQGVIQRLSGDADSAETHISSDDLGARGIAKLILADCYRESGDITAADQTYPRAVDDNRKAGSLFPALASIGHWGDVRVIRGQLRQAMTIYSEGLDLIKARSELDEGRGRGLLTAAQIYGRMSAVMYEWNDLTEAEDYATRTIELYELSGHTIHGIRGYRTLAVLKHAIGDIEGALRQLRNLDELAVKAGDTVRDDRLRAETTAMNIRLLLAQNHPEPDRLLSDVARWVEARGLSFDDEFEYTHEIDYMILARLLIAQEQPERAILTLEHAVHAAESADRAGDVISYLTLLASAQFSQGDFDTALATITRALTLAEPEGYVRTFVDCGKPMQELLQIAIDRDIKVEYATRLLVAFSSDKSETPQTEEPHAIQPPSPPSHGSQTEPLNEREAEILRFMAAGLTNREIASELFISVNTVRWHAHNLFGKLGANRRAEAVAHARELGLL
ncbi:MAG: LuxR C-terminal-related transcriptional regulator [SAR202 cluster bacterium]|nr:LuxR C-terminal-related transcriptional regulator [SAR202 cluster bacterium]